MRAGVAEAHGEAIKGTTIMMPRFIRLPEGASAGQRRSPLRIADGLSLAAAPTFAIMALFTASHRVGVPDMVCSSAQNPPLSGMTVMYLLMSSFHSVPWLKLIFRQTAPASH